MTGTGRYTSGILKALTNQSEIENILTVGGTPLLDSHKQNSVLVGEKNWHRLINYELLGNRHLFHADAGFFPNYFIPHGFSIPSVAAIHDISFITHPQFYTSSMRIYYQNRIRHTLKYAHHLTTVSYHSKSEMIRHFRLDSDQITVVYPGISVNTAAPVNQKKKQFVYVGNIEPKKNILNMIDGFLRSGLSHYELVLIGKNHGNENYAGLVREKINSNENIRLLGYTDDHTIYAEMRQSAATVNVSFSEGFGLPVLESLALGTPVLVSDIPSINEIGSGHRVVVNPHKIESIAEGFSRLVKEDIAVRSDSIDLLKQQFDWDRSAKILLGIFEGMKKVQTPALIIPQIALSKEEKAVLIPGIYSGIFNCPIDKGDLYETVLSEKMSYDEFEIILSKLENRFPNRISIDSGFVSFSPTTKTIESRKKDIALNELYLKKHKQSLWLLGKLPFIKYCYFSGGTSHANNSKEWDIDLFIVATDQRVWFAYTMLRIFHRFLPGFKNFCLNYLVDESSLEIEFQRDFYTAHQIVYLKPVNSVSAKCEISGYNVWIEKYFPNKNIHGKKNVVRPFKKWSILTWGNMALMSVWINYLHRKNFKNNSGGIMLDSHRIKLHSNDHRPEIYRRFSKAISSYNISAPISAEVGVLE